MVTNILLNIFLSCRRRSSLSLSLSSWYSFFSLSLLFCFTFYSHSTKKPSLLFLGFSPLWSALLFLFSVLFSLSFCRRAVPCIAIAKAKMQIKIPFHTVSHVSLAGVNQVRQARSADQSVKHPHSQGISAKGAVANRLRRRTSDQTVLGSNPAVAAALSPWTRLFTPIVPRRSLHISFY